MKTIAILLLTFALAGCQHDTIPTKPFDITGAWVKVPAYKPEWRYHFSGNILTQSIVDFGATITALEYPYALREDTLIIGGDNNNAPRRWLIHPICDSIVEVRNLTAQVTLAPTFYLRRTQ